MEVMNFSFGLLVHSFHPRFQGSKSNCQACAGIYSYIIYCQIQEAQEMPFDIAYDKPSLKGDLLQACLHKCFGTELFLEKVSSLTIH